MLSSSALQELSSRSNWVLDVDDCMYTIESGLHNDVIKTGIVKVYNAVAEEDPKRVEIVERVRDILSSQGAQVADPSLIRADELGTAFPPIVQSLKETYPDRLFDYLNRFYGDEYHRVSPSSAMVQAFELAHSKGIGVYFYTNGPSSPVSGETSHLQKVLMRLGFDESMIEKMRPKTYDLLMSISAGRGKPTKEGMQDFLAFSGINPSDSFMADDGPKNLKPAREVGMAALWTWTTDAEPKSADVELAAQLGAHRVRDTGAALLEIAKAYTPPNI